MTTNNNQNKPNSGILFQNKDKKSPNQPDFTGKYYDKDIKEWRVAGWEREKDGKKYISLAFTDPDEFKKTQNNSSNQGQKTQQQSAPQENQTTNNNFNETDNDFGSFFDDMGS